MFVCNIMWVISEFIEENGVICIVFGSYIWDVDFNFVEEYESIFVLMIVGSICVFVGGLYYGVGVNRLFDE